MTDQIKQIGHYTYNQRFCLGEGSYGKVYEGTSKIGKTVAIKKVDKRLIYSDQYLRESIEHEIQILKKFNHPNIVKLEDVVLTSNSIYIITEFCRNGDLKAYLRNRKLSEDEALKIFFQLGNGMKEIVKQGIIHRDLKPANVLVHDGLFKICDFGFAKYFHDVGRMNRTCVGTPMYMSPQALKQKPYTNKSDVWSMGIVFYEMLFNRPPWQGGGQEQLYRNITGRGLQIPNCSKFTQTMLKGMLEIEQLNRWNWDRVFDFIQNPSAQVINQKPSLFYPQPQINITNHQPFIVPQQNFQAPQQVVNYVEIQNNNNHNNHRGLGYSKQRSYEDFGDLLAPNNNPSHNNYFVQDEDSNNNSPQIQQYKKVRNQVKMKPKNMLAVFQEDQTPSNEDPRFCYFILVELLLNPIKVPSFQPFMSSLYDTTLYAYNKSIEKAQSPYRELLSSELQELRQLDIRSIGNKNSVRDLARQVLNDSSRSGVTTRQWVKRFIQRRYVYDPI